MIIVTQAMIHNFRTNLTASGPRPNPQGSYHYGLINTTKTIILASSPGQVNGKQRYGINSVSYVVPDTPLKLADYFKISGVFRVGSISERPTGGGLYLDTSVMQADYRSFVEIVFQNNENIVQSYHLDGYSFFVVGWAHCTYATSTYAFTLMLISYLLVHWSITISLNITYLFGICICNTFFTFVKEVYKLPCYWYCVSGISKIYHFVT